MDGERFFSTKKSTDESVKDQGDVGCVVWLERHCPSWICTMWSDGKQTVLSGNFNVFEGCCAQEEAWILGKPELDVAPWQCASSCTTPYLQLSGKTSDILCDPSTLFSGLSPSILAYFFLFPKLKTTLKGCCFQTVGEIQENAISELRAITKCIPGSIPTMQETLGTLYRH